MKEKPTSEENRRLGVTRYQMEVLYIVCPELGRYDTRVAGLFDSSTSNGLKIDMIATATSTTVQDVTESLYRTKVFMNPNKPVFLPKHKVARAALKIESQFAKYTPIDISSIAEVLGVHPEYVRRIRRELINEGESISETVYTNSVKQSRERIKRFREELKLSNRQIAEKIGISYIAAIARSQRQLRAGKISTRSRRLSEEKSLELEKEVVIRLDNGASIAQIARELKYDWTTIKRIVKKIQQQRSDSLNSCEL